jgi:SAM-dependent methyltransferase
LDYRDFEKGVAESYFWFRAKRDLIKLLFESSGASGEILNIGAGVGEDLGVISKYGSVHVLDVAPEAIALIPDDLVKSKQVGDATSMPYADNSFDLVVAFDVLEHIENDAKAISELRRVLRPGGAFIFTVPAFEFLYGAHDIGLGHHRRYGKSDIRKRLSGFTIERMGYWMSTLFIPLAAQRMLDRGRTEGSVDYFSLPAIVNSLFLGIMKMENFLLTLGVPLPMGTTIFGICTKDDNE